LQRITELDGLRAIAIFAVFLCHFGPGNGPLSAWLALGWSGVDLFFAISGFLITGILLGLREHEAPYKTFYWRRSLRIFPPYYLALTLILLLAFLNGEPVYRSDAIRYGLFLVSVKTDLIKSMIYRVVLHVQPVYSLPFSAAGFYVPKFRESLSAFWSLSVEELFYLVWAPVILKGSCCERGTPERPAF
jgi:peptidoglycan/LPS O-acetylase OafA/YrhL